MAKIKIFFGLAQQNGSKLIRNVTSLCNVFFLNVSDLVEYELSGASHIREICGIEYINKQIDNSLISVLSYEDTVAYLDYEYVNREHIMNEYKEKAELIYIKFPMELVEGVANQIVYDERNIICEQLANQVVTVGSVDDPKALSRLRKIICGEHARDEY